MGTARIDLTLHGPPGSVALEDFGALLTEFQQLSREVARFEDDSASGRWRITGLSIASAHAEAVLDTEGDAVAHARGVLGGLRLVQTEPSIPAGFSEPAMKRAGAIGKVARRAGAPVTLKLVGQLDQAVVSDRLATNASVALRATQVVLGGFYGVIDTLNFRRTKSGEFGLRDEFYGRAIRCVPATDELAEQAVKLVRHRAFVGGEIEVNAAHQPIRCRATTIEELPVGVPIRGLLGADPRATGGMSTVDYVRSLREW